MKWNRALLLILYCLLVPLAVFAAEAQIYDPHANARQLISSAIAKASQSHKNIVLDFGANWCPDCHVLDSDMHRGELVSLICRNFVIVHISVGRFDRNLDIAHQYGIPLQKGIPALAVLDSHGKLIYSQKNGQFEDARAMSPAAFTAFFRRWAPPK